MARNTNVVCKSIFKSDKNVLPKILTIKWTEFVNLSEKNKGTIITKK